MIRFSPKQNIGMHGTPASRALRRNPRLRMSSVMFPVIRSSLSRMISVCPPGHTITDLPSRMHNSKVFALTSLPPAHRTSSRSRGHRNKTLAPRVQGLVVFGTANDHYTTR
eukprot:scaffold1607_cov417-Prasinococcus_capsulatus_cf.AAC.7